MAITNAQLAQKINELIVFYDTRELELDEWMNGTIGGGPNTNGTYPLTDRDGSISYVRCPAQLEDDVDNLVTGALGYKNSAEAAETAALAAQVAAEAARDLALGYRDTAAGHVTTASGHATAAANSATNSNASMLLAEKWAEEAEDVEVDTGQYSALHHAAKAATSAAAAVVAAATGISGSAEGDILVWNNSLLQWETAQPGSGVPDGTVTSSILRWDGAAWVEETSMLVSADGQITVPWDQGIKFSTGAATVKAGGSGGNSVGIQRGSDSAAYLTFLDELDVQQGHLLFDLTFKGVDADTRFSFANASGGASTTGSQRNTLTLKDTVGTTVSDDGKVGIDAVNSDGAGLGWLTWYNGNAYLRVGVDSTDTGGVGTDGSFIRLDGWNGAANEILALFTIGGRAAMYWDGILKWQTDEYGTEVFGTSDTAGTIWHNSAGTELLNVFANATNAYIYSYQHGHTFRIYAEDAGGTARYWDFDPDLQTFEYSGKEIIDANDAWLRLNQNGDFTNGTYTPGIMRADSGFRTGSSGYSVDTSGNNYIRSITGQYGTIELNGTGTGSYWGVSLGGKTVLMNHISSATAGIYGDDVNHWKIRFDNGSGNVVLYNAGSAVAATDADGMVRQGAGNFIFHATDYGNGALTISTSAASGGGNGDIWFRY